MQNTPEKEIDLMSLLFALWRRAWVVVLCAVVGAGLSFLYTHYFITPLYQASVSFYVDNTSKAEESDKYISGSSLSTAQRLVDTYVTIIQSDTVLRQVISQGDLDLPPAQLRDKMSAGAVNETEVFRIYISDPDPKEAAEIANMIAHVVPGQMAEFLSGSSTKVIDYAVIPDAPYTPNYQRNVALGAMIGAVIAAVGICLTAIMDVRIEDEEELERMFDRPVLGSIPAFEASAKVSSRYSSYGYGKKQTERRPDEIPEPAHGKEENAQ